MIGNGCICPNKKCKIELQFEIIGCSKMRIYKEVKGKKVYNVYCPTCDEYMQVNEKNRKLVLSK
jgi:hypothetical protein